MPRDFYPRREADIVGWTANFRRCIEEDPEPFGISETQVSHYAALQQAFADAYQIAQSNSTRTPTAVIFKEDARIALEAGTRMLTGIARTHPGVNDSLRVKLGLPPAPTRRKAIPPPDELPILRVVGMTGSAVQIHLMGPTALRPGRPADVNNAMVFGYVGEEPSMNIDDWKLMAQTTSARLDVHFEAGLPPGTKVWLCAYWANYRGKRGPACAPVYAHLPYSMVLPGNGLRLAA